MSVHPSGMLLDESAADTKKPAVHNPLEQFVLLAKGTKGAACTDLIKTVLEAPGVYVFAELLAQPNIVEVRQFSRNSNCLRLYYFPSFISFHFFVCRFWQLANTPNAHYLNTLNLFAYGTYKQYLDNKSTLIELTDVMKKKLKHLTIVTMAIRTKCISYTDLLEQLDIKNVRELEDLIIESIYSGLLASCLSIFVSISFEQTVHFDCADIIHGKLDQKNKQLEVDYAIGRDIRPEDISKISSTLQEWCDSCESVLHTIEIQIDRANAAKAVRTKHTEDLEAEVSPVVSASATLII